MTILNESAINSIYTKIVADYISKGYVISTRTFGGVESREICHVDLVKEGKQIIRVWMSCNNEHIYYHRRIEVLYITVKSYDNDGNTIWRNKGELIFEQKFYEVREDSRCYSDSVDEALAARKLHSERCRARFVSETVYLDLDKIPDTVKNSIVERIRSVKGAKRANFDSVISICLVRNWFEHRFHAQIAWQFNDKTGCIIYK